MTNLINSKISKGETGKRKKSNHFYFVTVLMLVQLNHLDKKYIECTFLESN